MATGGAAASSDDAVTAAMKDYLAYQTNPVLWQKAYARGRLTIPKNEELTAKLYSLLTPETVNKLYEIDGKLLSPIHIAAKYDRTFAKKLIDDLNADILLPRVTRILPGAPEYVETPLSLFVEEYKRISMFKDDYSRPDELRKEIIDILIAGLASDKYYNNAKEILEKAFTDRIYDYGPTIDYIVKNVREVARWRLRRHATMVWASTRYGGARRTRKQRSRRHRNKSLRR